MVIAYKFDGKVFKVSVPGLNGVNIDDDNFVAIKKTAEELDEIIPEDMRSFQTRADVAKMLFNDHLASVSFDGKQKNVSL